MKKTTAVLAAGLAIASATAQKPDPFKELPEKYWDFALIEKVPAYREAPAQQQVKGLKAVLVEGFGPKEDDKDFNAAFPKPLKEKTKAEFFAYIGIPSTPMPKGGYPGIVLIHGGGGTAFPGWTKMWVDKGFVVIALDWYNQMPVPKHKHIPTNSIESKIELPGGKRQDHISNVANMAVAHSLLRSLKEVNPEKTAFVGLSWGSWYGTMLASLDNRFNGGVLIYCGDRKFHRKIFNGRFVHAAKVPLYWVVSTHDQNVNLRTLNNSFKICPTIDTKSIVIELPHSHIGFEFDSCFRMAEYYTTKAVPALPKLSEMKVKDGIASCKIISSGKGIKNAVLCYTDDDKQPKYHLRKWKTVPAEIKDDTITAKVPKGAYMYYISAYEGDSKHHDLCGSTNPVVKPYPGEKTPAKKK
ncbi:MAG: dienelactone hydrolase family protein [Lentisphaeria bacterium]|nr:dienelactone hydrolase family protein [Lentisphaeria bacterium]